MIMMQIFMVHARFSTSLIIWLSHAGPFFIFISGSFNMERMLQRKIKTLQLEPLILGFGLELLLT